MEGGDTGDVRESVAEKNDEPKRMRMAPIKGSTPVKKSRVSPGGRTATSGPVPHDPRHGSPSR
jgi:hypothetical protein